MQQPEIFSSTGQLGTQERQDGRLYHNARAYYDTTTAVTRIFDELVEQVDSESDRLSRAVFRGLVSGRVVQQLAAQRPQNMEVALSVRDYGQVAWLLYLGHNHPTRQSPHSAPDMVQAIDATRRPPSLTAQDKVPAGFETARSFEPADEPALHTLWGQTFGWNQDEISALRLRLNQQRQRYPIDRDTWFSALRYGGQIVSAAMAEHLELEGPDKAFDIVESTEWRTESQSQGKGLMPFVLRDLNAQIIKDLQHRYVGRPLIYAECNYTSRSDRSGYRAGFRIPNRQFAPQIIPQNVRVNDGKVPCGLRDFSFMYVPFAQFETTYLPVNCRAILHQSSEGEA